MNANERGSWRPCSGWHSHAAYPVQYSCSALPVTRTVKSCAVITVLGSPIASTVDYSSLPVKSHREELVHTRDTPTGTEMGAYSQYGGIRSI